MQVGEVFETIGGNKLLNKETGEIITSLTGIQEDIIRRKEEQKQQKANNNFVNSNMDSVDHVMESLTRPQRGLLLILMCYLEYYEKGGKVVHINRGDIPLTRNDIGSILNCSKQTLSDFLKACEKSNIMFYDSETKTHSINKEVAFKGGYRDMGINVVSFVAHEFKEALSELKPAQLGLIYDLQKFIHKETLLLCKNPYEPDRNKIEPLNQKQLAKALGVSEIFLKKNLNTLVINNQYVIARIITGTRDMKIMVNPNFVFRGDFSIAKQVVKETFGEATIKTPLIFMAKP